MEFLFARRETAEPVRDQTWQANGAMTEPDLLMVAEAGVLTVELPLPE
jgi:hypothetical protein